MGWDSKVFLPNNGVWQNEAEKETNQGKRTRRCAECNRVLGAVSTAIYEIEEKHYCSECYSRKIVSLAVERDHSDLKQQRKE